MERRDEALRAHHRRAGRLAVAAGRRGDRARRPQRRGQDDADQADARARPARTGGGVRARRRSGGRARRGGPASARLPARERRVPRVADGARVDGVLRAAEGLSGARERCAARARRHRARGGPARGDVLERHAPAARHRAGADRLAAPAAVRRADQRSRPRFARRGLRDDRRAARERRDGAGLHARARGDRAPRRSCGDRAPRPAGRRRLARRAAARRAGAAAPAAARAAVLDVDGARADARSGALPRARRRFADAARAGRREDARAARDRCARRARRGRRSRGAGAAAAVPALDRVERGSIPGGAAVVNAVTIALHELRIGLRNRWVAATTVVLAALALSLALLGSAPTGIVKTDPVAVVVVSLSSLTILLVPLIALMLSFDAIVGEHERGTL